MLIKSFTTTQGVSKNVSPQKNVLKRSLIFEKYAKGIFGSYDEINKDTAIIDTNCGRALPGILLGLTGNIQGTLNIFDIKTGMIKKCCTICTLPMPQEGIKSLNDWAKRSARE